MTLVHSKFKYKFEYKCEITLDYKNYKDKDRSLDRLSYTLLTLTSFKTIKSW